MHARIKFFPFFASSISSTFSILFPTFYTPTATQDAILRDESMGELDALREGRALGERGRQAYFLRYSTARDERPHGALGSSSREAMGLDGTF